MQTGSRSCLETLRGQQDVKETGRERGARGRKRERGQEDVKERERERERRCKEERWSEGAVKN